MHKPTHAHTHHLHPHTLIPLTPKHTSHLHPNTHTPLTSKHTQPTYTQTHTHPTYTQTHTHTPLTTKHTLPTYTHTHTDPTYTQRSHIYTTNKPYPITMNITPLLLASLHPFSSLGAKLPENGLKEMKKRYQGFMKCPFSYNGSLQSHLTLVAWIASPTLKDLKWQIHQLKERSRETALLDRDRVLYPASQPKSYAETTEASKVLLNCTIFRLESSTFWCCSSLSTATLCILGHHRHCRLRHSHYGTFFEYHKNITEADIVKPECDKPLVPL